MEADKLAAKSRTTVGCIRIRLGHEARLFPDVSMYCELLVELLKMTTYAKVPVTAKASIKIRLRRLARYARGITE